VIISFEGGEGAGKSTHTQLLCSHLDRHGLPWLSFREPGGSSFSEDVRKLFFHEGLDAMTELLLVLSSRRQNITRMVRPALCEKKIVVIDRFIDSTLVYQGVLGGLGTEKARAIMELTETWIEPDLTFVLDIDPRHALSRIVPGDKFELQGLAFHDRLRQAFLDLATGARHRIVDADRSRDRVSRDILSAVDEVLFPES
jgi:dTMP kinase